MSHNKFSNYSNNNNHSSSKPRRFTQCNTSASTRPNGTIALLDPTGCRGLLHIPLALTVPTRGRDEWLSGKLQKDLSLCTLFQKGRCHAHQNCFQVHVDVDYMTEVRKEQASMISCCQACGDTGSKSAEGTSFLRRHIPTGTQVRVTFPNGEIRKLEDTKLAYTEGLVQQFVVHRTRVENQVLEIPIRRVCRLHLKSYCKYGKDCKNVHLCCQLGEKFLEEPVVVAVPVVVPTAAVVESVRVEVEEEALPMPIPCFRVPSLLMRPSPLSETARPFSNDLSQDDADFGARSSSFKHMADASGLGSRRGFSVGKMFLFDAEIALEDSKFDQSVFEHSEEDSFNSNSTSGVSQEESELPNSGHVTSRRPSLNSQLSDFITTTPSAASRQHAIHLNPLHPCSKVSLMSSPACRLNAQDIHQIVSMFAIQ